MRVCRLREPIKCPVQLMEKDPHKDISVWNSKHWGKRRDNKSFPREQTDHIQKVEIYNGSDSSIAALQAEQEMPSQFWGNDYHIRILN